MGSTPIDAWQPSPATLLFNKQMRALLPQINMEPINLKVDDEHCEAPKTCQDKYIKGNVTSKDSFSSPIGSTVADQHKEWVHGMVEEMNVTDHQGQSCIIRVMNTGKLIMHNMRYICNTLISTEQYLWEQIQKGAGWLEDIFMEARSVNRSWYFTLTQHTQMHTLHNGRWEESTQNTPFQKSLKLTAGILCLMANWAGPFEAIRPTTSSCL